MKLVVSLIIFSCLFACGDPSVGPPNDGGFPFLDRGPVGPCEVPLELCEGECVDTRSSGRHCGTCGNICAPDTFCQSGACASGCDVGLTECDASCVDTMTDPDNCGMCGATCAPGSFCIAGECSCSMDFISCDGACVDPNTDPGNCGLCGRTCGADQRCNAGSCVCLAAEREMNCTDGADDDCDTMIDCADPDCAGTTRACTSTCGPSTETCQMDGTWGECAAGTGGMEICGDGIDQDCDGSDRRMPDMYETNDTCSACAFPTADEDPDITIFASIDSVDDRADCFAFDVVDDVSVFGPETIEIELSNIPTGQDYDVYLFQDRDACVAGTPIASGVRAGSGPERVVWAENFATTDSGTYYVKVIPYGSASHSCTQMYELHFNGLN